MPNTPTIPLFLDNCETYLEDIPHLADYGCLEPYKDTYAYNLIITKKNLKQLLEDLNTAWNLGYYKDSIDVIVDFAFDNQEDDLGYILDRYYQADLTEELEQLLIEFADITPIESDDLSLKERVTILLDHLLGMPSHCGRSVMAYDFVNKDSAVLIYSCNLINYLYSR
jgi:hypothetical protein